MRCCNAAMSKPFQFSMLRLFVAVSLACVAAFLFSIALRRGINEALALMIVCASGVVAGAVAVRFEGVDRRPSRVEQLPFDG